MSTGRWGLHSLSGYRYMRGLLVIPNVTWIATLAKDYLNRFFFDLDQPQLPMGLWMITMLLQRLNAMTRRKDGTINRALADALEIKVVAYEGSDGISSRDVVVDPVTKVWVRLFLPRGETFGKNSRSIEHHDNDAKMKKLPIIIYFHGGGFGLFSADFIVYDQFCRRLAQSSNAIVFSVNYRRAPEYPYPTPYDDCFTALQWLQSESAQDHLPSTADLSNCYLVGDSAGGNIVHTLGCRASHVDLNPIQIRGLILLQPFFGGEQRTPSELKLCNGPIVSSEAADWHWRAFLPRDCNRDHPACNIFGPHSPDLLPIPLPPALVVVGSLDILQDWQTRYASQMTKMGKKCDLLFYQGGLHGFYLFSGAKMANHLLSRVHEFIQSHTPTITNS